MASILRRSIPAIVVFLINTGLTISGYQNPALAIFLWALIVPAAGFAVWPWAKRIRLRMPFILADGERESNPGYPGQVFTPTVTQGGTSETVQRRDREIERLTKKLHISEQRYDELRAQLDDPIAKKRREEQMLRKRCFDVAEEVYVFATGYNSKYIDVNEAVQRFQLRIEDDVTKLRDELDRRGWLTTQEPEELTLLDHDGMDKIGAMAITLKSIGEGH